MNATPPATVLWNRDFGLYWLGLALSALGDAFMMVALPFLVLEITGSPAALATTLLLGTLPRFLGPITGSLADRLHLRAPIVLSSIFRAALFASLALLALAGSLPLWLIYVAAPLNGLLTSFIFAAGMVLIPNLVPERQLARANGLVQGATMGVPLLGLGVAGMLVAGIGTATTILIASPCLLALALAALLMRFPASSAGPSQVGMMADLRIALGYLLRRGPLAFLLVLSLVLNASLNLLNVTMPVVMERIGRSAQGYGIFESLLSAGILTGIVAVSLISTRVPPRFQLTISQLLMVAGFAVLGLAGFRELLAGGLLLGVGLGFSEVAAVTLLQLAIPDGMRGKVLGTIFTVNALGLTLGASLAGVLVESVGVSVIFWAAAVAILALSVIWTALHVMWREVLDSPGSATA